MDMQLRYLILKMCLDVEHFLKINLLHDLNENQEEDGYSIVELFFKCYPNIKDELNIKHLKSSCKDIMEKYIECPAIWNIIEVLSFGQFMTLYELYYSKYPSLNYRSYLGCIKFIRNAAAHNNCLLNSLRKPYSVDFTKSKKVTSEISKIEGVKKSIMKREMSNPVIHDFVALICAYDKLITSVSVKKHRYDEINELFNVRFVKNKDYYAENSYIMEAYNFLKIIVDNYIKK